MLQRGFMSSRASMSTVPSNCRPVATASLAAARTRQAGRVDFE